MMNKTKTKKMGKMGGKILNHIFKLCETHNCNNVTHIIKYNHSHIVSVISYFILLNFYLAPGILSFALTNPEGAQTLRTKFSASTLRLIQGVNSQSDNPKKQFALNGFQT
jgi:hypothetical protein